MKIALCLAGRTGGVEKNRKSTNEKLDPIYSYNHYKKFILNIPGNDVDIYIHCWNPDEKSSIVRLYQPIDYIFENPVTDNNVESRTISIKKCLRMVEKSKIDYDFIMISRLDVVLLSPFNFSKLPAKKFIVSHWNDRGKTNNYETGFYDLWFIANLKIFNKLLKKIPENFYEFNPHFFWKRTFDRNFKTDLIEYLYYVGKDYELTRRYYYPNNQISDDEVKRNVANYIRNFQGKR